MGIGFGPHGLMPKIDGDDTAAVKSIGASSAAYQLPKAGDYYLILAVGNTVYLKTGDNTVTVDHTVGDFGFAVPDGVPIIARLPGTHIAYIGVSGAGFVQFIHLDPTE